MATGPNAIARARGRQKTAVSTTLKGLTEHEAELPPVFVIGRKRFTLADLTATLQGRLDALQAADDTRAAWLAAVQRDYETRETTKLVLAGLRQTLLVVFDGAIDVLTDFGLAGRKKAVVSPETRVLAAQKARATRAARHTMGKRQKAAVKGDVTGVVVTPVTAPAPAAATSPTPAASAPATPAPTTPQVPATNPSHEPESLVVEARALDGAE